MTTTRSILLAFAICFSFSAFASGEKTEELARQLKAANPKGKAAVLAALPSELKENFVLVKRSRSRQRGSAELPRILHFTKNTDLVVSSSGHDATMDRAANDLEIMEFDEKTGAWIFSTIVFDDNGISGLHKNVPMCKNCHGDRPRPIWGDYPNWPTAFGGSSTGTEKMEGQELAEYEAFKALQPTHEGYRHLMGVFGDDKFTLGNSTYANANTTFTARLGVRTAQAMYLDATARGTDVKKNGAAFAAAALSCSIPKALDERVVKDYDDRVNSDAMFAERWSAAPRPVTTISLVTRLLDLDPTANFELQNFPAVSERRSEFDLQSQWNSSSDYLPALLAFKFFYAAYQRDAKLKKDFAAQASAIEAIERDSFLASNAWLAALDKPATAKAYQDSLFPYLHTNVWKDAASKKAACENLVRLALEP